MWDTPGTKNEAEIDLGRGLLPGETYHPYPRRGRVCAVGNVIEQISGFGVVLDPAIGIDLRMSHETKQPR